MLERAYFHASKVRSTNSRIRGRGHRPPPNLQSMPASRILDHADQLDGHCSSSLMIDPMLHHIDEVLRLDLPCLVSLTNTRHSLLIAPHTTDLTFTVSYCNGRRSQAAYTDIWKPTGGSSGTVTRDSGVTFLHNVPSPVVVLWLAAATCAGHPFSTCSYLLARLLSVSLPSIAVTRGFSLFIK